MRTVGQGIPRYKPAQIVLICKATMSSGSRAGPKKRVKLFICFFPSYLKNVKNFFKSWRFPEREKSPGFEKLENKR